VVWCGVVWCGVVWCGVVWCGVVWCGFAITATVAAAGREISACHRAARRIVEYMIPENAALAMSKLDGSVFQGRIVHVLPGKARRGVTAAPTGWSTPRVCASVRA
jgi:hypothetical protein